MIIFVESGRLGNQLFQYAALRTIAKKNERIVLVGFEDLQEVFDGIDAKFVTLKHSSLQRLVKRIRGPLESLLRELPIVRSIREDICGEQIIVDGKLGYLNFITYCHTAYFQSPTAFNGNFIKRLDVKPHLSEIARKRLDSSGPSGRPKVFIHVRRGDYLHYPSAHAPAVLPESWYFRAIETMQSKLTRPIFYVASDDPSYVRSIFKQIDSIHFLDGSPPEDFAAMAQCDSGILSASTFAWWAAFFARRRYSGATFIAPEFWMGHHSKTWHPQTIKTPFFDYLPVLPAEVEKAQGA